MKAANIFDGTGSTLRADSATGFAYVAEGTGMSAGEQFFVMHAGNPSDPSPIQAGQSIFLQSGATNM
jgi:hypothetical protein